MSIHASLLEGSMAIGLNDTARRRCAESNTEKSTRFQP